MPQTPRKTIRVRLNQYARSQNIGRRAGADRVGTVISKNLSRYTVRVIWDGNKSPWSYAWAFLEIPPNRNISISLADYISRVTRQWGVGAAISSEKIRSRLTEEEIIGFAERNGIDASRDAA